jgi:hypothetical protein
MVLRHKTYILLLSALMLSACNENRDDNISVPKVPVKTLTLQGIVLGANAIQGAIVCLDTNDNLLCETQEPQAKTNQLGAYQFNANAVAAQQTALVAYIPQGAMDVVTKEIIEKPYTLTTPTGKHAVISPLSSFVMETMRLHQGMDIDTASQIVSYQLKVKDFNVFKDYRNDNSEIAKLILDIVSESTKWGKNLENAPDTIKSYKHLFHTVTLNRLDFIDKRIPVKYSFDTLEPEITGISSYQSHLGTIPTLYPSYYNKAYTMLLHSEFMSDFPLYSIKPFSKYTKEYSNNFQYVTFKPSSQEEITQTLTEYSKSSKADIEINQINNFSYRYILTNNGWQISNTVSLANNKNQKFFIFKYDLSKLNILDIIKAFDFHGTINTVNSIIFPEKSYAYKIIIINNTAPFEHQIQNVSLFSSLDNFKEAWYKNNSSPSDYAFELISGITLINQNSDMITPNQYDVDYSSQLLANNKLNIIRTLQKNKAVIETKTFTNEGSWQEKIINNNKVLTVTIPHKPQYSINYLEQPFYTEHDNKVFKGEFFQAGHIQTHFLFNKTAMDTIKANLVP